jgi:asparagine synthase (glutamine-hydrolysing)
MQPTDPTPHGAALDTTRCIILPGAAASARRVSGDWGYALIWGTPEGIAPETLGKRLAAGEAPARVLETARGFFALVVETAKGSVAAVDRVSSLPLLFRRRQDGGVEIGVRLADFPGALNAVDEQAVLQLATGGQTIGRRTVAAGIERLPAGHMLLVSPQGAVTAAAYWRFEPWRRMSEPSGGFVRAAQDVLLTVARMLDARAGDRPVVVPLSAGLDSRAIVAALHQIGRRNVLCFSYGLPGNHEAVAARGIAEKLNYKWLFIPYSTADARRFFTGEGWRDYSRFAAGGAATPFNADVMALDILLRQHPELREGIFVNGQSGDYITGMHIPATLDDDATWPAVAMATIKKHFSLWGELLTPAVVESLADALHQDLLELGAPDHTAGHATAIYETSEFYNRQAKYVIGGQRAYDFFGLDWDLPLWREEIVDFFGYLPLKQKMRQQLYVDALSDGNWGGVWRPMRHPHWVVPRQLELLRWPAKLACAPFGKARWRKLDRHLFAYWMDIVCNYAAAPYGDVLFDRLGHRNAISWVTRRHIQEVAPGISSGLFPA